MENCLHGSQSDFLREESQQKDLLIAQLKAEAFELRQKNRDFQALH
jgi:peptidoglycan hydrolase CwlO-like protein